jgi:putative transcriptional regulator
MRIAVITLLCTFLLGTMSLAQSDLMSAARDVQSHAKIPEKGMFLVAARDMRDPRFLHSVVLLVRHGEDGTTGLIINRPTTVLLSQAVADLKGADRAKHTLYFGGPVQMNVMMFLIRSGSPIKNADQVSKDVYLSGSRATLEKLLGHDKRENELRVYAGYAGWAPGQLDTEIAEGDWHLVPADTRAIFEQEPVKVWQGLIDQEEPDGLMVKGTSAVQLTSADVARM